MKKKIAAIALVVALLAVAVIGGTLAFFTDTDDASNTFTVGNVDIELYEPNWDGVTDDIDAVTSAVQIADKLGQGKEDSAEVYPGEALLKDPIVYNKGANPCFIRVKVSGLEVFQGADPIFTRYNYVDGYNTTDWALVGDYYYYLKPVAAGAATSELFSQIVIPYSWTNGDAKTEYSVDVFAEAVQAQGMQIGGAVQSWSAIKDGVAADALAAWFNTCGMDN